MVPSVSFGTTVRRARPELDCAAGRPPEGAAAALDASAPIAAMLPDCKNRLRFIDHLVCSQRTAIRSNWQYIGPRYYLRANRLSIWQAGICGRFEPESWGWRISVSCGCAKAFSL